MCIRRSVSSLFSQFAKAQSIYISEGVLINNTPDINEKVIDLFTKKKRTLFSNKMSTHDEVPVGV